MGYQVKAHEKMGDVETWIGGKRTYLYEFFGTMMWFYMVNKVHVFGFSESSGMALGFTWALATMVTRSIFDGDHNALVTMVRMIQGSDPLDGLVRLIFQMLAGMIGTEMFGFFGWDDKMAGFGAAASGFDFVGDAMGSLKGMGSLFFVLLLWKYMSVDNKDHWLKQFFILGLVFAVADVMMPGSFHFAPNRVFCCQFKNCVGVFASFWGVYLAYAVCGFLANYVHKLLNKAYAGDWDDFKNKSTYEPCKNSDASS